MREAERFLNKTMAGVDAGRVVATQETFSAYMDRWLREHRPRIEEGTYRDYHAHIPRLSGRPARPPTDRRPRFSSPAAFGSPRPSHLTWTDVDLDGQVSSSPARKRGRERAETSGSTKGDRARAVEFGPRTAGMLRDLRARQAEHRSVDLRSRPVFATADGRRLSRNTVSRGWHKAALRDADLRETLRLHDLRHTAAASWLAGLPLIYVQRQLGHASITTTEAQYGHLDKGFSAGPRNARRRPSGRGESRRPPRR